MEKIFELDFTKFSPSGSTQVVDNLGGPTTGSGLNIQKLNLLPEFEYRPGIVFYNDGTVSRYSLDPNTYTTAGFSNSYDQRSFVVWYYTYGDSWDLRSYIYCEGHDNGTIVKNGWRTSNTASGVLQFWVEGSENISYPDNFLEDEGWKLVVATADRTISGTTVYGRSEQASFSGVINGVANTSIDYSIRVGDNSYSGGKESHMALGYIATYSGILTESAIDALYGNFIADSRLGDTAQDPTFESINLYLKRTAAALRSPTEVDFYYSGEVPIFNFTKVVALKNTTLEAGRIFVSTYDFELELGKIAFLDMATSGAEPITQFTSSETGLLEEVEASPTTELIK